MFEILNTAPLYIKENLIIYRIFCAKERCGWQCEKVKTNTFTASEAWQSQNKQIASFYTLARALYNTNIQ